VAYRRFSKDGTFYIYGLFDPVSGELRYIGQTTRPGPRLNLHISSQKKTRCQRWIKSLLNQGLRPEMAILEETTYALIDETEAFYIAYFRFLDCNLCNHTDGGNQHPRPPFTEEHKRKISEGLKGRIRSPEHCANLSKAGKGRVVTDAYRKKMSEVKTGGQMSEVHKEKCRNRRHTAEEKAKIGEANRRRVWTDESRAKVSESLTGHVRTEESKAKQAASNRGRVHSEETKAKMAEARRKWHEARKTIPGADGPLE
jgi:hypothetical protein